MLVQLLFFFKNILTTFIYCYLWLPAFPQDGWMAHVHLPDEDSIIPKRAFEHIEA